MTFTNENEYPFYVSMIGTSHCAPDYHITRQKSWTYCLEYILSGRGYISQNDAEHIAVSKGDTYMLHQNEKQDYYTDPEQLLNKIWMNFSGPVAKSMVEAYGLSSRIYWKNTNILPYLEEIHHILDSTKDKKKAFDRCARVFLHICQILSAAENETEPNLDVAERIKDYIDNYSDVNISLDEVITYFHYSKSYAIRSFRKKYNCTPYSYILVRKIEAAKSILRNTEMSIKDISDYLQFSDTHYFSKFFSQHVGVSPKKFRENNI